MWPVPLCESWAALFMNKTEILHYLRTASRVDDRVCIFGATLGFECDRLLRTYSVDGIARGAVMQAVLASKIEEVCDGIEDRLRAQGLTLRQRYSPGYFDLDITEQRKIFALLDLTKRIGLTLSDTCQMIPTKSVTAIIGIEPQDGGQAYE